MSLFSSSVAARLSLSNIKTKPKVLLSVAVPILLALMVGVIALVNMSRMDHTQQWVDHTQEVLTAADGIVANAINMETRLRGYLLAGQDQFLAPYDAGNEAAFSALAALRETVSDNPSQVARLQQAENVLRQWQSDVALPQKELRKAIGDAPTMNDMAKVVRKGEGKVFFDKFRGLIATFIENEKTLLDTRAETFSKILSNGNVSETATREALRWVEHTHAVIATAKDILAAAVDMETGMRGYLVAGDEAFLEPFNGGKLAFSQLVTELSQTVSDNPAQVALLAEVKGVIDSWLSDVVTPMLELRHQIGDAKTMDDIADMVGEARGKVFFDEFREIMADFSAEEAALMIGRRAENDQTRFMTEIVIFAALIAAVGIGVIVALLVGSNIGNAVKSLTDLMRRLADGDNAVEITGQDRGDEIGQMAQATEVFKQNAIRVAALSAEQETASKQIAAMAEEREKAAHREAELAREKVELDRKMAAEQEEMMVNLGKSFGTVVESAIDGEFSRRVETNFSNRILNDLAKNINQLMDAVESGISETGRTLACVAEGNLTQRMEGDFRGAFARLQDSTNNMIESLTSLVGEITGSGETLATSSAELRDTAGTLAKQAEQNAAALEETSAALEELSASVRHVSGNISTASKHAQLARETAQSSGKIANEAASSMTRISQASKEISKVVGVINEISFQINLLALNAGVEAARAGEAGRGFSVVASEVRLLAQRASEAAKEIGDVITRSDAAVSEGVAKVSDAQSSLETISDSVISIAAGVDDISIAISEQVTGLGEISAAVGQIDQNTQKQAASFEEVTAAGGLLATEANSLRQSTARFRIKDSIKPAPQSKLLSDRETRKPLRIAVAGGRGSANDDGWDDF